MRNFKFQRSKEDCARNRNSVRFFIGGVLWIWGSWRIVNFYEWIAHSVKTQKPPADTFSIKMLWDRSYSLKKFGYEQTSLDFFIIGALCFLFAIFLLKVGSLVFPDDED